MSSGEERREGGREGSVVGVVAPGWGEGGREEGSVVVAVVLPPLPFVSWGEGGREGSLLLSFSSSASCRRSLAKTPAILCSSSMESNVIVLISLRKAHSIACSVLQGLANIILSGPTFSVLNTRESSAMLAQSNPQVGMEARA